MIMDVVEKWFVERGWEFSTGPTKDHFAVTLKIGFRDRGKNWDMVGFVGGEWMRICCFGVVQILHFGDPDFFEKIEALL